VSRTGLATALLLAWVSPAAAQLVAFPVGQGCALYGAETPAPVVVWIHPGGYSYPRGTSERIVSFFRDHPRTR
jgi:hypothetical protein